jgi:hypothetical protein
MKRTLSDYIDALCIFVLMLLVGFGVYVTVWAAVLFIGVLFSLLLQWIG